MKILNKFISVFLVTFLLFGQIGTASAAATAVSLGTADSFAVLAGTAITNIPTSIIIGNVGLSPAAGSNITGLTPVQVTGTIYAVDSTGPAGLAGNNPGLLTTAKNNLATAFTTLDLEAPVSTVAAQLGATTQNAGIYDSISGSFQITGTLTLDAQGDADAVFIFKTASTLTTAANSNIILINGAQACNVYWIVGSSATLGTASFFKGNVLASASITLNSGANVEGRVLAKTGAVTLSANTITKATCSVPAQTNTFGPGEVAPVQIISTTTVAVLPVQIQATSTVVLSTTSPSFPNTGLDSSANNISWSIVLASIAAAVLLFYVSRRKSIF